MSTAASAPAAPTASASAASAPAAAPSPAASAVQASSAAARPASTAPDLLPVGASLALVIALLLGLLWSLKRLQRTRGFGRSEKRLQVVESMALGARHKVAIIRVDHREVLVGITPTQMTTLASWAQPASAPPADFQASMAQARAGFEKGRD